MSHGGSIGDFLSVVCSPRPAGITPGLDRPAPGCNPRTEDRTITAPRILLTIAAMLILLATIALEIDRKSRVSARHDAKPVGYATLAQ